MNMAILFISGMCMGAGILMSTLYGAKDMKNLEKQISTTLIGGLIFSMLIAIFMIVLAVPILRLINSPEEIIGSAAIYLRVVFLGLIFTFVYNFLANITKSSR